MRVTGTSGRGDGDGTGRARFRLSSLSRIGAALAAAVVLALGAHATAHAGDKKHNDKARAHFETGTAYFRLEKYPEALQEFEQGYLEKQDPAYLFNIAKCHRQLGRSAEAMRFFRRFVNETPNGHPQRAQAEQALRELEGTTAPAPPFVPPPPPPSTSPPAPPRSAPPAPSVAAGPAAVSPMPPAPSFVASPLAPPPVASAMVVSAPAPEVAAAPEPTNGRPVYKKWWFWTLVGAAVVGGILVGVAASSGHSPDCPDTRLCI